MGRASLPALPWPLAAIDFEASSLDDDSYPIEVGLALWTAPGQPILGWSALIQPVGEWTRHGHWSAASAKVHGIRGSDLLAHGHPPAAIAAALNAVLGSGAVAWCDGGPYDAHWAGKLFAAAGTKPAFPLGDWHHLLALCGPAARERAHAWLANTPVPHRARDDAQRLLLALAHGLDLGPAPAQDLAPHAPALAALASPHELRPILS